MEEAATGVEEGTYGTSDSTEGVLTAEGVAAGVAKLKAGRLLSGLGTTAVPVAPAGLVEVLKPVGPAG